MMAVKVIPTGQSGAETVIPLRAAASGANLNL
jgi:hypothetical protein